MSEEIVDLKKWYVVRAVSGQEIKFVITWNLK